MFEDTGEQHSGAKEVFCHASVVHSYSYSIWHGKAVQPTREPEAHGVILLQSIS